MHVIQTLIFIYHKIIMVHSVLHPHGIAPTFLYLIRGRRVGVFIQGNKSDRKRKIERKK